MQKALVLMAAGIVCASAGAGTARADCGWDIRMVVGEIAEVEGAIPLAQNPGMSLGAGTELPPQQRSTMPQGARPSGRDNEGIVGGAFLAGQEVVPDRMALTGRSTEGSVPGPAEEPLARSPQPEGGLIDAPSRSNEAAGELARAKLRVQEAQSAWNRNDRQGCAAAIQAAQSRVAGARRAISEAAGGG